MNGLAFYANSSEYLRLFFLYKSLVEWSSTMALKLCLQLNSRMEICLKTHVWEVLECCRWYHNWISQLEILCSENIMFITYKTDCSTSPLTSNGCWMADTAQIIKPFTWQEREQKGCGSLQGNTTNILDWQGDLSSVAGHLSLMHGLISLRYSILFFSLLFWILLYVIAFVH